MNVNRRTTHRTPDRTRGRGAHSHRRGTGLVAGALIDRVERVRGAHLPGGMQAEVALDGAAVRNDDRVGHAARVVDVFNATRAPGRTRLPTGTPPTRRQRCTPDALPRYRKQQQGLGANSVPWSARVSMHHLRTVAGKPRSPPRLLHRPRRTTAASARRVLASHARHPLPHTPVGLSPPRAPPPPPPRPAPRAAGRASAHLPPADRQLVHHLLGGALPCLGKFCQRDHERTQRGHRVVPVRPGKLSAIPGREQPARRSRAAHHRNSCRWSHPRSTGAIA